MGCRTFAQARDLKIDVAGSGIAGAFTIAIALDLVRSRLAGSVRRAGQRLHLGFHPSFGREGRHLPHEVCVSALFQPAR